MARCGQPHFLRKLVRKEFPHIRGIAVIIVQIDFADARQSLIIHIFIKGELEAVPVGILHLDHAAQRQVAFCADTYVVQLDSVVLHGSRFKLLLGGVIQHILEVRLIQRDFHINYLILGKNRFRQFLCRFSRRGICRYG
ncbi:hypothetical protein D3C75_838490 [compost metagenome]